MREGWVTGATRDSCPWAHGGGAHPDAGLLLPPDAVLIEEAGGMGHKLCPQERPLPGTNGRSTAGMAFGGQGDGLLLLLHIPFDGGQADAKHAGDLGLGSLGRHGGHNLGA